MVDLAGSEKIAKTGVTGDGVTEACAINQSLSALANVIKALGKKQKIQNPKEREKFYIPYRTSKLTQVLQQGLGGDSKTIMIAALRPDISNYEESLTTLQYASRVKLIKNCAKKVETEDDILKKLMKEHKAQQEYIKKLEEQLKSGKSMHSQKLQTYNTLVVTVADTSSLEEIKRLKEELEESKQAIAAMQQSEEEKQKKLEEAAKNLVCGLAIH